MTDSIVDLHENSLVDLLYEKPDHFQNIAILPQCPWPSAVRLRVRPEQLGLPRETFGDADALLVPECAPELSRVIEFKRIKIKQASFRTELPNKLQEIAKAAKQANALAATGFSYVWVVILIVTDSWEHNGSAVSFLGATSRLLQQVQATVQLNDFTSCIGVHVTEIAQPMDKPVTDWSSMGGSLLRLATGQTQPAGLTEGMHQLIAA